MAEVPPLDRPINLASMPNLDANSAPLLVLLPGLDGSGELFRDFSAALPTAWDRQVIAYPPDQPWGYDRLVEFVGNQLPPDWPLILLGESFSGPVALRLAAELPDRVAGLILACTFAECPSPLLKLARPWLQADLCRLDLPAVCIRYWLCDSAGTALAREVSRLMRQVTPAVRAARFRALADVDLRDRLPQIRCPILCLTATHDRLIEAQRLPARLKEYDLPTTLVRIEGPHLLLQTAPQAAADALARWAKAVALFKD